MALHETRDSRDAGPGRRAIVNLSSIYGIVGAPNTAAYTVSKHGVAGLTKVAALDYAGTAFGSTQSGLDIP